MTGLKPTPEAPDTPASILIVDDMPENIDVVAGILREDYRVRAATRGSRALEIATSDSPPDLILLDIMMPEMDGLEVCRQLKSNPDTRDIPIIFLSAMDKTDDIVAGLKLGAVDYVTKPATPSILKARVHTHLQLRMAQKRLLQEMELIQENARLRDDVERITRHDLKNPLGIILGYASMLAEDPDLDEVQRESARFMEESAYNMMNIINNSLNLYKIEQGSYQLEAKPLNIIKIIDRSINELQSLAQAMDVRIRFDQSGANIMVLGEKLLCYSLLGNLIRNAVEASPKGREVVISVEKDEQVYLYVHNQGLIPEEIRDQFFDKYVTAGKKQGTGLGTYSARLLTEIQNGEISFESSKTGGTTLIVALPSPYE
jgi:two-component system, sensor histidine kinase and response regulator